MTPLPNLNPGRILLVRADAIGDHVLFSGMLPHLRARFPNATIALACPDLVAGLFEACPFLDRVIPFNKRKLHRRFPYRAAISVKIRAFRADLVLNAVYSRDTASDLLSGFSGAEVRIAHRGDLCNMDASIKSKQDSRYTHLLEDSLGDSNELERHRALLGFLGGEGDIRPLVWMSGKDQAWASRLIERHGLDVQSLLAFFPGAQNPIRTFDRYSELLKAFLERHPARILALGSEADRAMVERILRPLSGSHLNLCGETTLSQAAALLELCRAGVGAETGLAHLAAATGLNHVVLLGGGHFGRFMPTSSLTRAACLPLRCYGCNWNCDQERPYCIRDIPTEAILQAMADAWNPDEPGPSIYFHPSAAPWPAEALESLELISLPGFVKRKIVRTPVGIGLETPSMGDPAVRDVDSPPLSKMIQ